MHVCMFPSFSRFLSVHLCATTVDAFTVFNILPNYEIVFFPLHVQIRSACLLYLFSVLSQGRAEASGFLKTTGPILYDRILHKKSGNFLTCNKQDNNNNKNIQCIQ